MSILIWNNELYDLIAFNLLSRFTESNKIRNVKYINVKHITMNKCYFVTKVGDSMVAAGMACSL